MEAAGIELGANSSGKTTNQVTGGAECGAVGAPKGLQEAPIDSDLAAVIEAWPALPNAIKADILSTIRSASHPTRVASQPEPQGP